MNPRNIHHLVRRDLTSVLGVEGRSLSITPDPMLMKSAHQVGPSIVYSYTNSSCLLAFHLFKDIMKPMVAN